MPKHNYPSPALCTFLPFDIYPFLILGGICFLTFGSYWSFDIPGAIFTQLQTWFGGPKHYTSFMNLSLYSIYSYPNIILPFFGGLLVDKMGVRLGTISFCFLCLAGQTLFAFGVQIKTYWLCLLGRFVFGLGGESLTVAQNTFTARWFDGQTLAMAFGLVVSFSRIGSSVNFLVTPIVSEAGVSTAVWLATAMCGISMVSAIYVSIMDKWGSARVKEISADEKISLADLKAFPIPIWIVYFICISFYCAILSFYTVASDIMQHSGGYFPAATASTFIFIPNFVSIFASSFFGWLIDKIGKSINWLALASIMLIIAHIGFLVNAAFLDSLDQISPIALMIWLGVGYSMGAASMWPMLAIVIPNAKLGTAYGMMTALQNAGLAITPQLIGVIQARPIGIWIYVIPILIFVMLASTSFGLCVLLYFADLKYTRGQLNASVDERRALQAMAPINRDLEDGVSDALLADDDATLRKGAKGAPHALEFDESSGLLDVGNMRRTGAGIRATYLSRIGVKTAPKPELFYTRPRP